MAGFLRRSVLGLAFLVQSLLPGCGPGGNVNDQVKKPALVGEYCARRDSDCLEGLICEDFVCVDPVGGSPPPDPDISDKVEILGEVDGVKVKRATTDEEGKAYFTDDQTGHEVVINFLDENNYPLLDASVVFFDGDNFEYFVGMHPDYEKPASAGFAHNSSHTLRMNLSPLQMVVYDGETNDNDQEAMNNFVNWAKRAGKKDELWQDYGCIPGDEVAKREEIGTYLFRALAYAPVVSQITAIYGARDSLVEVLRAADAIETYDCKSVRQWAFIPEDNFPPTGGIIYNECSPVDCPDEPQPCVGVACDDPENPGDLQEGEVRIESIEPDLECLEFDHDYNLQLAVAYNATADLRPGEHTRIDVLLSSDLCREQARTVLRSTTGQITPWIAFNPEECFANPHDSYSLSVELSRCYDDGCDLIAGNLSEDSVTFSSCE